jgi:hypothetical protein
MKVLAFLQNLWIKELEKARRMIDCPSWARGKLIEDSILDGCDTSGRAHAALRDRQEHIIWIEASPVIRAEPREYPTPDIGRIVAEIDREAPDLIICFKGPAGEVITEICKNRRISLFRFQNPTSRNGPITGELRHLLAKLNEEANFRETPPMIDCGMS